MPYDDLRSFLDTLDKEGQLLRITEQVLPEPDLAAAANAAGRIGEGAPALYFDNVKGFTDARIAMNVHGSWRNHALALGLPADTSVREQVEEFARRWDAFPVAPERREDAPWRENAQQGPGVDLFTVLPLFRLNDGDGGFYLDKAAVVSRDPRDPDHFGKQNVGTYRIEVIGRDRLAFQPVPMHDVAQHLHAAEEVGKTCPSRSPSAMTRSSRSSPACRWATTSPSTRWPAPCAEPPPPSPPPRSPASTCPGVPRSSSRAWWRAASAK